MDLNKIAGEIERELTGMFPSLSIRRVLAEGGVNARGSEIHDEIIAVVSSVVRAAEAQSVELVTGFRSRHGATGADMLEYSVFSITLNLKPNVMAEHFACLESHPDFHGLTHALEASNGMLETAAVGLSRLRLTVCLPYTDEIEAPMIPETVGGETVLLVEDEEFVRGVTKEVLEMAGYRVIEASNGESAISAFNEYGGSVDLVLTDVVMPGMNGPELADYLAKKCPDLKTLFMSGYTENAVLRRGLESDCAAYLQKPFALETLTAKVREVLGSEISSRVHLSQRAKEGGTDTRGV